MPIELQANSTLQEIQQEICKLRIERGFGVDIIRFAFCLYDEMGEMISQIRTIYVDGQEGFPKEDKSSLQHEMADIFIYFSGLSSVLGIDIEQAWISKECINNCKNPICIKENAKLKDIQKEIARLRTAQGSNTDVLHLTFFMYEELVEMMNQVRTIYLYEKEGLPEEHEDSLKHKLAGFFTAFCALATSTGIDLEDAWISKEKINDTRKWNV